MATNIRLDYFKIYFCMVNELDFHEEVYLKNQGTSTIPP
jgi:hypothetical protein